MSALVFLVVSLAGGMVVGALRSTRLAPARAANDPASDLRPLYTDRALRRMLRPSFDPHTGPSRPLPDLSVA